MNVKDFIKKSYLRPWDVLIVLILALSSFLPLLIFNLQNKQNEAVTLQAVLKVDGAIVETFDLVEGTPAYTYKYEDADGDYNVIEVAGNRIRIIEASCGDLACVRRGWLSRAGEPPIACLPHNLFITVEASDGNEDGSLIY